MTAFYIHCVLIAVICIADATGTLEPVVTGFEQRLGIVPLEEPEEIPEKIDEKELF
jgi:hypothetical protein